MEFDAFKSSLAGASPPAGANGAMQALWWQAKGDWHKAHRCAQAQADERGAGAARCVVWSGRAQRASQHAGPQIRARGGGVSPTGCDPI